jgi:hypothetical protein
VEATKYITLQQVMRRYDKTYTQVRYATETHRLTAIKAGWQWLYPVGQLPSEWPEAPRNIKKGERKHGGSQ